MIGWCWSLLESICCPTGRLPQPRGDRRGMGPGRRRINHRCWDVVNHPGRVEFRRLLNAMGIFLPQIIPAESFPPGPAGTVARPGRTRAGRRGGPPRRGRRPDRPGPSFDDPARRDDPHAGAAACAGPRARRIVRAATDRGSGPPEERRDAMGSRFSPREPGQAGSGRCGRAGRTAVRWEAGNGEKESTAPGFRCQDRSDWPTGRVVEGCPRSGPRSITKPGIVGGAPAPPVVQRCVPRRRTHRRPTVPGSPDSCAHLDMSFHGREPRTTRPSACQPAEHLGRGTWGHGETSSVV